MSLTVVHIRKSKKQIDPEFIEKIGDSMQKKADKFYEENMQKLERLQETDIKRKATRVNE